MLSPQVVPPYTEDRFWAKVDKDGPPSGFRPDLGPCWLWTGYKNEAGYGIFYHDYGRYRAHRMAYQLLVAPIPEGLTLDHLCRVTRCVNPAHLEPVTHVENTMRGFGLMAENARKTHCYKGHEFTPENTYTTPAGTRNCRACHRVHERERRAPLLKGPADQTGENGSGAKLTTAQVAYIRSQRGLRLQREVGAEFGIGQSQVSAIQLGKSWAA